MDAKFGRLEIYRSRRAARRALPLLSFTSQSLGRQRYSRMNRVFACSLFSVFEHPRTQTWSSNKYSEGKWFNFRINQAGSGVVERLKRIAA